MISYAEYLERVLVLVQPLAAELVPTADAIGLVLAEDVMVPRDLPGFDNASMDGYAVRAVDIIDVPATLQVTDDIAAGAMPRKDVEPGGAARIMTGAPMPGGADAVIRIEWTDGGTDAVRIDRSVEPGNDIRRAGEDLPAGGVALPAGTVISPRSVALLASCDRDVVLVHRRPLVTVISTGDELVVAGQPVAAGQVVDSNGPLLLAVAREAGAMVRHIGPVADDAVAFAAVLEAAVASSDLVITSGGVSMGAYDTVKAVLSARGGVSFTKVAMNPGMPQGCGAINGTPIITLPGNPVSTYVSFEAFVRPALRLLMGYHDLVRPTRSAIIKTDLRSPEHKRQFARGVLHGHDELTVTPVRGQGSHMLSGLADANCLVVLPEGVSYVEVGDTVDVIDLR